jgi:hypothetical protein
MVEMLENKMLEHLRMAASAKSDQLIDTYLNSAPKDRNYATLARLIDSEA